MIIDILIIAILIFAIYKLIQMFNGKKKDKSFANKTDDEILEIWYSLDNESKNEIREKLASHIAAAQTVSKVKSISLDSFDYSKQDKYYNASDYYGLTKYKEISRLWSLINS